MKADIQDVARRLVRGHDKVGRKVFDEAAKAELVALCREPGASVRDLARQCGVGVNQLRRWVHGTAGCPRAQAVLNADGGGQPFTAVQMATPITPPTPAPAKCLSVGARLPNGVMLEIGAADARQIAQVIDLLGRL